MAGELTPEQIRDGGTGSVGSGNIRAPDYRQVVSAPEVRTDLPNNEAGARAAALGSVFREFEGVSGDIYSKAQTQAGALAGAAAGATGHPQYREGLARFTAYSQAFNNAATGAYAVEAEAQADDAAARLRVTANNNPATFQATYSAVRDGVLKNAPAQAVPMLTELYNKRLAAGLAAITGDQAAEQRLTQRATYDVGVQRLTSRVAILQGSENPQDHLEALDERTKLSALIDGGLNAGLYSQAEAQAMHTTSMRTITAQVFQTQVDRELARPDGNVVQLLENFRLAHVANLANPNEPPILSEPEYQKLYADATTKIREQNLLETMNRREGRTAEQIKFEAGDQQYTSMLLQGRLTERALDTAVRSGDLKPERATGLRQLMNNGDQAKSDPKALWAVHTDPNFLDMKPADIAAIPGVNFADKLKMQEEIDRRKNGYEGTQPFKDGMSTISAALKVLPGTPAAALSDQQRSAVTDAAQEYRQRMNEIDPAKRDSMAGSVAKEVVTHIKQQEAQADLQELSSRRASAIKNHGPGTAEEWDDAKLKAYLKQKDDAIAAAKQRAGQ